MKNIYKQIFSLIEKNAVFDNGLLRTGKERPHTKEVADLPYASSGVLASAYYACAVLNDKLNEEKGLEILKALSKLQITDETSELYGGFRWYREEKNINDSNGTFFILKPLVSVMLLNKEKLPESHIFKITQMLRLGYNWFLRECQNPMLYYPNKIMSDGALLLSISKLIDCKEGIKFAITFWKRWNEYTDRRGWGWGENTSLTYIAIMLDAIHITLHAMPKDESDLIKSLTEKEKQLVEYIRFHNGRQPVPSIRTYNFSGECYAKGIANTISGVRLWNGDIKSGLMMGLISIALSGDSIENSDSIFTDDPEMLLPVVSKLPVPRTDKTKIFDDAYAYSYVGKNCRLGTINKMPTMPGCYQHKTWGLGWQSMPVAFVVDKKYTGFLRFSVMENDIHHTHPAIDKHSTYLSPALFGETHYPECKTFSNQENNIAVIIRKMENVINTASHIKDEWYIQNFDGEVNIEIVNGKQWVIITHSDCVIAICSLKGSAYGECNSDVPLEVKNNNGVLTISHILYNGEQKVIEQEVLESAWAIVMFDESTELGEVIEYLENSNVTDEVYHDFEVSRTVYTLIRKVGFNNVQLSVDPYKE